MLEINGRIGGKRISSRDLDETIQRAVKEGARQLDIIADGQHGIGGRIWPVGEKVKIKIEGAAGQRLGGMGMDGTEIVVNGSASDDVGWINCGATITVLGDVANGAHNAGAQGKLYVKGGGGARCDTLTKFNPRFEPIQSWYFRDVGDSFAEFKAGGTAVVCGVNPRNPENILGYRPCVGMVGGTIYFRGPAKGVSENDVRVTELTDADWSWLCENMKPFLKAVDHESFYKSLTRSREEWRKIVALTPDERARKVSARMPMSEFKRDIWFKGVGQGGIFADYLDMSVGLLPFVTTGENRRQAPVWDNMKFAAPCAYSCPTGIPTDERTRLLRDGKDEEALDLVLKYSPFPGSVCGYVCPNLCMAACSRLYHLNEPVDVALLGRLSLDRPAPKAEKTRTEKVAVIGGGPGGMSAAWQLALRGYQVSLYEREQKLGGKIYQCIPRERLPADILEKEINRFLSLDNVEVHTGTDVDADAYKKIYADHDAVVLTTGCHSPRTIPFPGYEDVIPGIVFLKEVNTGVPMDLKGKKVVVIGAGNVGMDICVEAFNCGAETVTAVDIQKPASFGKEQRMAKDRGTVIEYPKFTEKYDAKKKIIHFKDGTSLPADVVIISIGETPELDYLPPGVDLERGFVRVDEKGLTTDPKVFAVGDAAKPGLITDAIGSGLRTALNIHALLSKTEYEEDTKSIIPYEKIKFQWYDRSREVEEATCESDKCLSCAGCRDCHVCEANCYWNAISRVELPNGSFEYKADPEKCIGCGFCAGVCPCGIWTMYEQ